MRILHIALQGCLRPSNVEYGITTDTGGHIRYLLDLVDALVSADDNVDVTIITRRFHASFAPYAAEPLEEAGPRVRVVRIGDGRAGYLPMSEIAAELPCLEQSLMEYLLTLPALPDIVHAHYGEAAVLAHAIRDRFGIPFMYTPHSYARVRLAATGGVPDAALVERINREDLALATADMVTASSVHEAEQQAALSPSYRPGVMKVLPPGVDVESFDAARVDDSLRLRIERPLVDRSKAVVLAVARPVWKKNLRGVVQAFAASKRLRERANLLIIAGTHERLADLEPEAREVMQDLLNLVHEEELDGLVSMPRSHVADEIPAFFRYCYEQHGVFASPALSEPYGLTLLEAAAAGVPVVGSIEGAPSEIVANLGHGAVVPPNDARALASTLLSMIDDLELWNRRSSEGRVRVRRHSWRAHAIEYMRCLRGLTGSHSSRPQPSAGERRVLVCDIDGTLVGDPSASERFRVWLENRNDLIFVVATGRRLHDALETLRVAGIPAPEVVIASVGAEIYWRSDDGVTYRPGLERPDDWAIWPRELIRRRLDIAGLVPQSLVEQRPFKLGYLVHDEENLELARTALHGLPHTLIWSHGRYLDVLPPAVNKASAVNRVCGVLGVSPKNTIVAGDSGNDREMLATFPNSVLVSNWTDGLGTEEELSHAYVSPRPYADGVIDGVEHLLANARLANKEKELLRE